MAILLVFGGAAEVSKGRLASRRFFPRAQGGRQARTALDVRFARAPLTGYPFHR
jgi:hypothetical protein